jgi:hypothetical protein
MLAEHLFGILNLGHWNLFEIWFLVLGIFMIFIEQVTFVYSAKYLFKRRSPDIYFSLLDTKRLGT